MRVLGIPKPQARPRFFKAGNHIATYSPKTDWFQIVYMEALKNRPPYPLDGPLCLSVRFVFPRPKSLKRGESFNYKRPDLDNAIKSVMDALTNARWWVDDGRVAALNATKVYESDGDPAGAWIEMAHIKEIPPPKQA